MHWSNQQHILIQEIPTIRTVYGAKAKDQSVDIICGVLWKAGFETEVIANHKHSFFVKAKILS